MDKNVNNTNKLLNIEQTVSKWEEESLQNAENAKDKDGEPLYPNIREFYKVFQPTEEDSTRTFTNEEAIYLCQNVKCYVDMTLFNPCYDYIKKFEKEGRLQRWSTERLEQMLLKAIKRYPSAVYTDKEIETVREFDRKQRNRDNYLLLRSLKSQEENIDQGADSDGDNNQNVTVDVQSEDINKLLENSSETSTFENEVMHDILNINTDSIASDLADSQQSDGTVNTQSTDFEQFNSQIPYTSTQSQSQTATQDQAN